ncbi:MAG: redoxin domain-containing protein, partial [Actinomycetes bacterium]
MPSPLPQQPAPTLEVPLVAAGRFRLGDRPPSRFTLVVFYRGWHCPICRTYLAQLDRAVAELEALGVMVVAVSGDTEERARQSVEEWKLTDLA